MNTVRGWVGKLWLIIQASVGQSEEQKLLIKKVDLNDGCPVLRLESELESL